MSKRVKVTYWQDMDGKRTSAELTIDDFENLMQEIKELKKIKCRCKCDACAYCFKKDNDIKSDNLTVIKWKKIDNA